MAEGGGVRVARPGDSDPNVATSSMGGGVSTFSGGGSSNALSKLGEAAAANPAGASSGGRNEGLLTSGTAGSVLTGEEQVHVEWEGVPFRTTRPSLDLVGEIYGMGNDTVQQLQEALFVGGYFGNSTDLEDIRWGSVDEDTFEAWRGLISDTARRTEAGQKKSWQQVLSESVDIGMELGVGQDDGGGPQRAGRVINLSDPKALGIAIDQTAQKLLGRKVSVEAKRAMVGAVQTLQRQQQEQGIATQEGGGVGAIEQVDAGAQIQHGIRDKFADEAAAHDMAGQMGVLMQMIGGN